MTVPIFLTQKYKVQKLLNPGLVSGQWATTQRREGQFYDGMGWECWLSDIPKPDCSHSEDDQSRKDLREILSKYFNPQTMRLTINVYGGK